MSKITKKVARIQEQPGYADGHELHFAKHM